ncbi:MAG: GGDEF domain-containing protein, partial [Gammaproteobacteria bacterium]|nr:GGDEF domain-containing protein [Gammaproteobacteria bacterium]
MTTQLMTEKPESDKSEQLLWLGLYDNLTRLPNRYLFLDRLHHIKRHAAREKYEFAVLMIELGDLEKINEEKGHHSGEQALIAVASRLQKLARDSDTIARFGNNEFTVILRNISSMQDAESIAAKYVRALNKPISTDNGELIVNASIGVSYYPNHSEDINELLHKAEKAMLVSTDR